MLSGLEVKDEFGLLDLPEEWEPRQFDIKDINDMFNKVYIKRNDYYTWIDWLNTLDGPYIPSSDLSY